MGKITIGNAADYAEKLRACHVIVDHEERQNIIRDGAAKAASDAGLDLVEISPNANPPVCKIMDFGKFKYETQKREAEARLLRRWCLRRCVLVEQPHFHLIAKATCWPAHAILAQGALA